MPSDESYSPGAIDLEVTEGRGYAALDHRNPVVPTTVSAGTTGSDIQHFSLLWSLGLPYTDTLQCGISLVAAKISSTLEQ